MTWCLSHLDEVRVEMTNASTHYGIGLKTSTVAVVMAEAYRKAHA